MARKKRLNWTKITAILLSVIFVFILLFILKTNFYKTSFSKKSTELNSTGFKNGIKIDLLGFDLPIKNNSYFYNSTKNNSKVVIGKIINVNTNKIGCKFNISIDDSFITTYSLSVNASSTKLFEIPLKIPFGKSQISLSYFCNVNQ